VDTGQVPAGSAVRYLSPGWDWGDGPAARCAGGDAGGRDEVAVAFQPAVRAAKHSSGGLGDPPVAGRAGGGRAPLVDERQGDGGGLGLVAQHGDQLPGPPVADPLAVDASGVQVQDASRVAHDQGADLAVDGPFDDVAGCLAVGLADPADMPGLG
jgi:hypothetical protein